jgi:hypothetical protein
LTGGLGTSSNRQAEEVVVMYVTSVPCASNAITSTPDTDLGA